MTSIIRIRVDQVFEVLLRAKSFYALQVGSPDTEVEQVNGMKAVNGTTTELIAPNVKQLTACLHIRGLEKCDEILISHALMIKLLRLELTFLE